MQDVIVEAVDVFGEENQINMAIEEMGELIVALQHYKRGRVETAAVCEEIADVKIMMEQLSLIFGSRRVDQSYKEKKFRLYNTILYKKNPAS